MLKTVSKTSKKQVKSKTPAHHQCRHEAVTEIYSSVCGRGQNYSDYAKKGLVLPSLDRPGQSKTPEKNSQK